tara:strand:- start:383 stop:553 length:171 start_codon:yes stop_codon:yes gene_type:complete
MDFVVIDVEENGDITEIAVPKKPQGCIEIISEILQNLDDAVNRFCRARKDIWKIAL